MTFDTTFNYLVLGLERSLRSESEAELFRWACHQLALAMPHAYPRTQAGLLSLFEQPVKDWYPYAVPERFDSESGLLYDGDLSEEACEYCYDLAEQADMASSVLAQHLALENVQFRELLDELKRAYDIDAKNAQQEYVLLRRFLIENPYATAEQLSRTFFRSRYVTPKKVGGLYEPLPAVNDSEKFVWECSRCGPLTMKRGQLRGVKPSVCNDHRRDMDRVRKVDRQPGLRRLMRALHLRVCIPGIPEIELFEALEELCESSKPGLQQLQLYPGIDCYDLQLRFSDGTVWAVDVKDYPNPIMLTRQLTTIYGGGSLRHDESFYVVPQAYIDRTEDYVKIAQSSLKKAIKLLGARAFERKVSGKIAQLQQSERK